VLNEAYALDDADKAKALLERHARAMEDQHPGAASSLSEGLDEMLTVMRLGIGPALRKSFATTNPIESTFATVRRVMGHADLPG
jgi:transposase-like protein